MKRIVVPKVLCHDTGALYCKHNADGLTMSITLTEEDEPRPPKDFRWVPVNILVGVAVLAEGMSYANDEDPDDPDDGQYVDPEGLEWAEWGGAI